MKLIKIFSISTTILFIVCVVVMIWCFVRINNKEKIAEGKLGSTIILNKDTLTIIDYSIFEENYTLSNGTKVNMFYLNNLKK
jgi:hypothetical protein